jgi:hypothetical protein
MSFDAVNIEYAFARLVGDEIGGRGTNHDADVFRSGRVKALSVALSEATDAIESRVAKLKFKPSDSEPGGLQARLSVATERLKKTAKSMASSSESEPNDYHWEIIGCLISSIAALLEALER